MNMVVDGVRSTLGALQVWPSLLQRYVGIGRKSSRWCRGIWICCRRFGFFAAFFTSSIVITVGRFLTIFRDELFDFARRESHDEIETTPKVRGELFTPTRKFTPKRKFAPTRKVAPTKKFVPTRTVSCLGVRN